MAYLLMLLGFVVLVAALTVRHYTRKHGAGPLLWRFLSGHALDGTYRTNATWLHPATKVLHPTGHAVRWHHLPRLHRAGIRLAATFALVLAAAGLCTWPAGTVRAALAAVAVVLLLASWRAWRAVAGWRHHRTWVRPLHHALADVAGVPPSARPGDWLAVTRDRTRAVIALPAGFAGKPALMKQVEATVSHKLAIEAPEPRWELEGAKPRVTIRSRPAPPKKVSWDDIEAAVLVAPPGRPVIGMGRGGGILDLDLDESPHILVSVPTGGGKSTLLRVLIPGMLAAGSTVAAVLDVKWISHPWVKGGLPNVLICQRVADIHAFLAWLHGEIHRRNEVAWAAMDVDGRIHGDVGPRIVVMIEELNSTTTELRRYWRSVRDSSDPDMSPAIDGLNIGLLMGRQVKVHMIVAGQQVTALSVGGGTGREQFGTRILGRYTPGHWRMLAEEVERMPPSSRHPGRVQVVAGAVARECQVAEITGGQAVELARTAPVPWPPTLPLSLRHGVSIATPGDTAPGLGGAVVTVTPPPLPGGDAIRLSDAVSLGVLHMKLPAARKASHRAGFPAPTGRDGIARLYDPRELQEWETAR